MRDLDFQRAEGERIRYRSIALITSRASRRSSLARLRSCRSRTSCGRAWHGSHRNGLAGSGSCHNRTFSGPGSFDQWCLPWWLKVGATGARRKVLITSSVVAVVSTGQVGSG